jgi:hypothetical protein
MAWLETFGQIWSQLVAIGGIIGTGVSTFFAIKATIEKNKAKSLYELWSLLMYIMDEAMKSAELSGKSGGEKKKMVIDKVKLSAEASGINITPFTKQINDYIDQTITFVNEMNKN